MKSLVPLIATPKLVGTGTGSDDFDLIFGLLANHPHEKSCRITDRLINAADKLIPIIQHRFLINFDQLMISWIGLNKSFGSISVSVLFPILFFDLNRECGKWSTCLLIPKRVE